VPELPATVRTVTRRTTATPEQVFAVLADGWSYATWVVGASRVRKVDVSWPAVGSRIHHSFGLWPVVINDVSTVLEVEPGRHLRIQAAGRPIGEATVDVTLHPEGDGCRVAIKEDATRGPGTLVPSVLRQVPIVPRNVEALRRLCLIAEGRAAGA
jgi:uncharacterized protein YndB with AHSA1/START domain